MIGRCSQTKLSHMIHSTELISSAILWLTMRELQLHLKGKWWKEGELEPVTNYDSKMFGLYTDTQQIQAVSASADRKETDGSRADLFLIIWLLHTKTFRGKTPKWHWPLSQFQCNTTGRSSHVWLVCSSLAWLWPVWQITGWWEEPNKG